MYKIKTKFSMHLFVCLHGWMKQNINKIKNQIATLTTLTEQLVKPVLQMQLRRFWLHRFQFDGHVFVIVQIFTWIIFRILSYYKYHYIESNQPSRSSPKLPQPIFLPTLKLGPTMRKPEPDAVVLAEPAVPALRFTAVLAAAIIWCWCCWWELGCCGCCKAPPNEPPKKAVRALLAAQEDLVWIWKGYGEKITVTSWSQTTPTT